MALTYAGRSKVAQTSQLRGLRLFVGPRRDTADFEKREVRATVHFEIALAFQGNAFRVVYAVQLADDVCVVHAFKKKSRRGIKTPKHEADLIRDRLKRLKEMLA